MIGLLHRFSYSQQEFIFAYLMLFRVVLPAGRSKNCFVRCRDYRPQADGVAKYVTNQAEHYKKSSFPDEYNRMPEKFEIKYDESISLNYQSNPGCAALKQKLAQFFSNML